jgi:phytoene synthase
MRLLAERDQPIPDIARSAGIAEGFTGLLRVFPLHASRRRLYIPDEILQRHGVSRDDIFSGHDSESLRAALAELRMLARQHLASIGTAVSALQANLVPALLPVALVRPYLDRMDRPDYAPFATPVEIAQWRRQWRLWRAARRPALIA